MIQPYVSEIETEGERSLIYFSDTLSHAVRKLPKKGEFRVQESYGGEFSEFIPSDAERGFGEAVVESIRRRFPGEPPMLYARVDYIRIRGVPHLMEAELLEPDLFLHHSAGAADRFADFLTRI